MNIASQYGRSVDIVFISLLIPREGGLIPPLAAFLATAAHNIEEIFRKGISFNVGEVKYPTNVGQMFSSVIPAARRRSSKVVISTADGGGSSRFIFGSGSRRPENISSRTVRNSTHCFRFAVPNEPTTSSNESLKLLSLSVRHSSNPAVI